MSNADSKTNKFLEAIKKYADLQTQQIYEEAESNKRNEIEKAENEGIKLAFALIQKETASIHDKVVREFAERECESRKKLFERRKEITDEIFEKAEKKLIDYRNSPEYAGMLIKSAREITEFFGGEPCRVYLRTDDMVISDKIQKAFNCQCVFDEADDIKIGGMRVLCENRGIMADRTLDALLEEQRQSFAENSGLRIN